MVTKMGSISLRYEGELFTVGVHNIPPGEFLKLQKKVRVKPDEQNCIEVRVGAVHFWFFGEKEEKDYVEEALEKKQKIIHMG